MQIKILKNADEVIQKMREESTWFWPKIKSNDLDSELENLLNTHDIFCKILESSNHEQVIPNLLNNSKLTPKMSIQHMMRISDCSAEFLDRTSSYIKNQKIHELNIKIPNKKSFTYDIKEIDRQHKRLNTKTLLCADNNLLHDVMMIILFGSYVDEFQTFASFQKLNISAIVGDKSKIDNYLIKRYLTISRQTQGKKTVSSGTDVQQLVRSRIKKFFENKDYFSFVEGNRMPIMGTDTRGLEVDLVCSISNNTKIIFIGIEVAFQETTNSIIERKARQATEWYKKFQDEDHYLCYVVDGGGYFSRPKAFQDIVNNSHITVTLKQLDNLCKFMDDLYS